MTSKVVCFRASASERSLCPNCRRSSSGSALISCANAAKVGSEPIVTDAAIAYVGQKPGD